jgi:hypothetical protein
MMAPNGERYPKWQLRQQDAGPCLHCLMLKINANNKHMGGWRVIVLRHRSLSERVIEGTPLLGTRTATCTNVIDVVV